VLRNCLQFKMLCPQLLILSLKKGELKKLLPKMTLMIATLCDSAKEGNLVIDCSLMEMLKK
jgi:hypothetical protein